MHLQGDGIIAVLDIYFVVTSNNSLILNDTFAIGLLLKALYRHDVALLYILAMTSHRFCFRWKSPLIFCFSHFTERWRDIPEDLLNMYFDGLDRS